MQDNKILDVSKDVKWIGILDKDIVTFDIVMETKYGTTYNSYFINADKKAIIDTSKETFKDTYLEKVKSVVAPSEIEYIICNHTEPDHSGNLKHLLQLAPQATVVGSGQALNYLAEMIGTQFKSLKVKDGDVLDLGNKKIRFIGAPNLHWPDTLYSYLEEDQILFTCDSFGAHFCHEAMFDDLTGDYSGSFEYYFDVILKPFSKFMIKAIEKIKPLDISIICPGHGPILRSTWKEKVKLSEQLSNAYLDKLVNCTKTVLVAYVSAYGYTAQMAKKIAEGLKSNSNLEVDLVDIETLLLGELEEKVVRSNAILIGSPTINQNTLLPIYKLFAVINPIRDKGKMAAVFGSYGWSGEAVGLIESHMKNLKFKVFQEGLAAKFYPYENKAEQFVEFGRKFAEELAKTESKEA
jgi:NADH oxidase (H2O-forming)